MIVDTALLIGLGFTCVILLKIFGVLHLILMELKRR